MLREISQMKKDRHPVAPLREETEVVKFTETESRMAVTENLGEGKRGMVIHGY